MRLSSVLAPLALLATAVPAFAGSIIIDGQGEVRAAPDMAMISSGVTTSARRWAPERTRLKATCSPAAAEEQPRLRSKAAPPAPISFWISMPIDG